MNKKISLFFQVFAFEEFVPELVKCENEELEQCGQDLVAKVRVIDEIGSALHLVAKAVQRARSSEWSAKPSIGALTWINQPRSMKYFIQHLNMAFTLLAKNPAEQVGASGDRRVNPQLMDDLSNSINSILVATECLARLVLGEQDQCQRNNSQIIAKFYEIGQTKLSLQLAEDFKVSSLKFKL